MNKIIAKILIAAMVFTTVITPVEFGFAETEIQQIENEQVVDAEQTVTEEMQFLYLEQQQVEAPGKQSIAVSWDDEIDAVTEMLLIYENSSGQQFELKESERTERSILFTVEFDDSEIGTYAIKGIKYFIDDTENILLFDDLEIAAEFEVVNEVITEEVKETAELAEKVEDNLAVVESTSDAVNNGAVQTQVMAVLEEAEATKSSNSKNIVVVLNPGHGANNDSGATRKLSDGTILKESDITLKIANACRDELNKYEGIDVHVYRPTSVKSASDEIKKIVNYSVSVDADVLVSLHINAAVSSSANGAEVWAPNKNYNKTVYKEGQGIAQSIQDELVGLGLTDRGVKESYSKDNTMYPDKSLADYYGIIRESKKKGLTGIIVEHAFISNASDRKLLTSSTKIKQLGAADALGIANYYRLSKGEWETTAEGKKYRYNDGSYAVGYTRIGSAYYYFDPDGSMMTGFVKDGSKAYYFSKKSGKGLSKGWQTMSSGTKVYSKGGGVLTIGYKKIGKYYYGFNSAGKMLKYSQTIGGKPYYFTKTGKGAAKGWITFKSGTKKYCLGNGKLATGYKKVGKYYYGFDTKSGKMLKYTQIINGKAYYFKSSGKAASKGWLKFKSGNKKYCLGNGKLATGTVKIGKTYYDFSSKGTYLRKTAAGNYAIAGSSSVTVDQMVAYYKEMRGSKYPSAYKNTEAATIKEFCQIYYNECKAEGIRAEVAFCQAMKETGWLKFGGDVKVSQYNFAGIGATGGGKPGCSFDTVTIGIRAHVQHLKAYANKSNLVKKCVDPRFHLVKRGSARYVQWLGQKANPNGYGWAPAATYGTDIIKMIRALKSH